MYTSTEARAALQTGGIAQVDSAAQVLNELARVDALIRGAVERLRKARPGGPDRLRGLYLTDTDIDADLDDANAIGPGLGGGHAARTAELFAASGTAAAPRQWDVGAPRGESRLWRLANILDLEPFDLDVLLIGLAPEIDLRYERMYAYLQDDLTKRRPSVDLVLNLLCCSLADKLVAHHRFVPGAPLLAHQLVRLSDDPGHHEPPLPARYVKVDERIAEFLLGYDRIDARLEPYATLVTPHAGLDALVLSEELRHELLKPLRRRHAADGPLVYLLHGAYGVGKRSAAAALCHETGLNMLVVEGALLPRLELGDFEAMVCLAAREALLQSAALYWADFGTYVGDEQRARMTVLLDVVSRLPGITFLASREAWEPAGSWRDLRFSRVELPQPDLETRVSLWRRHLGRDCHVQEEDLRALAGRFRLTGGQIDDAARSARRLSQRRGTGAATPTTAELDTACRLHSSQALNGLAEKMAVRHSWDDIVLSDDQSCQLREVCSAVRHRARVYDEWGFERRLSLGKGFNVLFAGPSGTGKSLAAEVVASELSLDLYRIDLSSVVSKYIGETEKNLARIFAAGELSNAILFFDEADALFGRRSEVRDAHDRYANIETSFLLQRIEEYEGVVVLATNLRKNMDEAFTRRMNATIEFPLPGAGDRYRIWAGIWPPELPRSKDLDHELLADRFELTGGSIRNIALTASFLAAGDGGLVTMAHVVRATRREYQKIGRVPAEGEFAGLDMRSSMPNEYAGRSDTASARRARP